MPAEPAAEETDARASSTRPAGRSFTVEAINPKASVSRASPARMAVASSKALWQEGRPRRRSSSSIAGRSSWMREYVWIISSEAAKGITASALRPNQGGGGQAQHRTEALAAREEAVIHGFLESSLHGNGVEAVLKIRLHLRAAFGEDRLDLLGIAEGVPHEWVFYVVFSGGKSS